MTEGQPAQDDDLAQVVHELYGLAPDEFTSARNARAKEAKAAGGKELAQAIGGLRKPSSAAWLLNQMVRHHGDEIDQLLAVGAALRQAQADLEPEQLKALSRQRHQVVAAVARQARALARELGNPVSNAVETEVEQTLRAALADDGAGRAVASGQLTKALDYAGLGESEVDLDGAVAVPGAPQPARVTPSEPAAAPRDDAAAERRREELAQARRDAEQADEDVVAAEAALAEAERHVEDVARRRAELEDQARELEERLAAARDELAGTGKQARSAGQERDRAAERAQAAHRAADRARARIARLSEG